MKTLLKKQEKLINISETINFINSFFNVNQTLITINDTNIITQIAKLSFKTNEILFKGNYYIQDIRRNYISELQIGSFSFISDNTLFRKEDTLAQEITFSFNTLKQKDFPENSFFRFVGKLEQDSFINPFLFERHPCEIKDFGNTFYINLKVGNLDYEVFFHKTETNNFIIIDCLQENDLKSFYDDCYLIEILFCFINNKLDQQYCFIVSHEDSTFSKPTAINYKPYKIDYHLNENIIFENPYSILNRHNLTEEEKRQRAFISEKVFNNMIQLCKQAPAFYNAIIIILQSSNYALETKPACLSVALEGISGGLCTLYDLKPEPLIKEKSLRKKFLNDLKNQIPSVLDKETQSILTKKIESNIIGTTNANKLELPFHHFGITLKNFEHNAIENRNAFLHSRLNFDLWEEDILKNKEFQKIYFETIVLQELLQKLIYKASSYEGYYFNFIKHEEKFIFGLMPSPENLGDLIEKI